MKIFIFTILDKTKRQILRFADSSYAPMALFAVAFAEASVFLVPPDILLVAALLIDRSKWIRYALLTTIGSVLGAFLGYLIGWAFYESIGAALVKAYHLQGAVQYVGLKFQENAFVVIFAAAFTPIIPFKAITIASGVFSVSLYKLFAVSLFGRGLRYFVIAYLTYLLGERAKIFISRYFWLLSTLVVLIVALLWWFLLK